MLASPDRGTEEAPAAAEASASAATVSSFMNGMIRQAAGRQPASPEAAAVTNEPAAEAGRDQPSRAPFFGSGDGGAGGNQPRPLKGMNDILRECRDR